MIREYSFNRINSSGIEILKEYISSLGEEFSDELELKSIRAYPLELMEIKVEFTVTYKGTDKVAFEFESRVKYRRFYDIIVKESGFNYKNIVPNSEYLLELLVGVLDYCVEGHLVSGNETLLLEEN